MVIPKVVEKNDLSKSVTSHLTTKRIIEKCIKVLAPGLLKIKFEPINAYFKKNRVVHQDYLKVAKEHVATLHELLEEAKALKPLYEHIGHASKFVERIQVLLVYVSASCLFTQSRNEMWAPATSHKKNNKPYVDDSRTKQTFETITQKHAVKQDTRKADNTMVPSTGRVSSNNARNKNKVESQPRKSKSSFNKNNRVLDYNANIKNVALSKNSANFAYLDKSVKQKEKFEWKPTGRIFKTVRLRWIPTGIPVDEPCPKLSRRYANARESLSRSYFNSNIHPFNLHDYEIKRILSNGELLP
ncbi:hypothetical protein Tco_1212725 [Tanacetum coccineum]